MRPEPVPTLDPQGAYLRRVWQNVVYPMAERMRIAVRLPPVQPRSRLAHEATYFAAGHNKREAFQDSVFRSFFQKGEDIGQEELLVRLAEENGLYGVAMRQALQLKEFATDVQADAELAERLGVQAVPAYVVERKRMITGVRTVDELLNFVVEKNREVSFTSS